VSNGIHAGFPGGIPQPTTLLIARAAATQLAISRRIRGPRAFSLTGLLINYYSLAWDPRHYLHTSANRFIFANPRPGRQHRPGRRGSEQRPFSKKCFPGRRPPHPLLGTLRDQSARARAFPYRRQLDVPRFTHHRASSGSPEATWAAWCSSTPANVLDSPGWNDPVCDDLRLRRGKPGMPLRNTGLARCASTIGWQLKPDSGSADRRRAAVHAGGPGACNSVIGQAI
jgi:hypothetical protein